MKYVAFICTHGRPEAQHTYEALRVGGYTGNIVFIVDDEDNTVDELREYIKIGVYDAEIMMFCKQYYIDTVDIGRRRSDAKRAAILYAKCACEDFAKEMELDAFIIADDDLTNFRYRYPEGGHLKSMKVRDLDSVVEAYFNYILESDISMTSFGAVQLFIGGKISDQRLKDSRIPYNILFRNTSITFNWVSEMNEDTAAVLIDKSGKFIHMLPFVKYDMKELMAGAKGGMTANYQATTTFQRIQTLIMYAPTAVYYVARPQGITHAIHKDNAFPKLISSSCKKI